MKAHLQSVEDLTMFEIDGEVYYCRPIPEVEKYFASTLGDIISTRVGKPKLLTPTNDRGYLKVRVRLGDRTVNRKVHRLVAAAFFKEADVDPDGDERIQINHIDSNKHNNRVANLEHTSRRENVRHALAMAEISAGL
jgi:hypothetical protein